MVLICFVGCGTSESALSTETTQIETTAKASETTTADSNSKILVAYFSVTGNTKTIAESVKWLEVVDAEQYGKIK